MLKIISFCLWGDNPRYTIGALRNAELCARIYPGWTARFAVGASTPRTIVEGLRARGAEVIEHKEAGDWRGMFWRFSAAADQNVSVMLSRDCDSRLNEREKAAVDAWLASDKSFHIMRDHPQHNMPILGGMWGVKAPLLRDINENINGYQRGNHYQVDQQFLARVVHPLVAAQSLVHDEFFDHRPFPTPRQGLQFVGQVFDEEEKTVELHQRQLAESLRTARPLKLLLIQERGRHERNRDYREALSLARSLNELGVEALVWGLGYPNYATPFEEISRGCDAVLTLENYDSGWHPDLSSFKGRKLFWSIDSHCVLAAHIEFCRRQRIDHLLNSAEQYLPAFRDVVGGSDWFPNAIDAELVRPPANANRLHDVGFCGSMISSRAAWLARLQSEIPITRHINTIGPDMVAAVASYRIGLNRSIADDVNYRCFEVPACGAMLLTNEVPNLARLLTPGEEIITYCDERDLIQKARHYLAHEEEREAIAAAGMRAVLSRHTYRQRAEQLIGILSRLR